MPVDPVILLIVAVVIANLLVMAVILIPPLMGRSSPMPKKQQIVSRCLSVSICIERVISVFNDSV